MYMPCAIEKSKTIFRVCHFLTNWSIHKVLELGKKTQIVIHYSSFRICEPRLYTWNSWSTFSFPYVVLRFCAFVSFCIMLSTVFKGIGYFIYLFPFTLSEFIWLVLQNNHYKAMSLCVGLEPDTLHHVL